MPSFATLVVAAPAGTNVPKTQSHRELEPTQRSARAIIELLRWFESTPATHLVLPWSPRVNLTDLGLARLAAVAMDTNAALLFSDFFDGKDDGSSTLHP